MKTSNKVLKAAAIASLLAGGAVAGSFINAESAQADPQSSKVSGALTSVLSNGVTNSFAAEVVLPQESIASTGAVTMNVTYSVVGGTNSGDLSQLAITTANMNAGTATYTAKTVEAATARAIDAALNGTAQYGAVSDIVKSFQNGGLDQLEKVGDSYSLKEIEGIVNHLDGTQAKKLMPYAPDFIPQLQQLGDKFILQEYPVSVKDN